MKKILVMNIGTEYGGIEKSLIEFLKILVKENCEIDLALWKRRGPLFNEIPKGINVIENIGPGSFANAKKHGLKGLLYYFKFKLFSYFNRAWQCVPKSKIKYDIAISYCQNGLSPYYIIDNVEAEKKYLWFHHGSYEESKLKYKLDKKYFAKYNKVITVSESNLEMLKHKFPGIKGDVIPNIIDVERIINMSMSDEDLFCNNQDLKLVTVGRISEEKGQLFSLEIARSLKENNIKFKWLFVGDGDKKLECENIVKKYDLENECIFVGSKSNPYAYIKQSDLYIQTSYVESEGITIKEAMVLNKIIITSKLPALQEILNEYNNFSYLCDFSIKEYIDKIIISKGKINQAINGLKKVQIMNDVTYNKIKALIES